MVSDCFGPFDNRHCGIRKRSKTWCKVQPLKEKKRKCGGQSNRRVKASRRTVQIRAEDLFDVLGSCPPTTTTGLGPAPKNVGHPQAPTQVNIITQNGGKISNRFRETELSIRGWKLHQHFRLAEKSIQIPPSLEVMGRIAKGGNPRLDTKGDRSQPFCCVILLPENSWGEGPLGRLATAEERNSTEIP